MLPVVLLFVSSSGVRLTAQPGKAAGGASSTQLENCALPPTLADLIDDSLAFVTVEAAQSTAALSALRACAAARPRDGATWFRFGYLAHLHHARAEREAAMLSRSERIRLRSESDSAMRLGLEFAPDSARFWYLWIRVLRHRDKPLLSSVADRWLTRALSLAAAQHDSVLLARIHVERARQRWLDHLARADRAVVQGGNTSPTPEMFLRTGGPTVWTYLEQYVRPLASATDWTALRDVDASVQAALAFAPTYAAAWRLRYQTLVGAGAYEELREAARVHGEQAPEEWLPPLVAGYALHRLGSATDAQSAFDRALAAMPPAERAYWLSTSAIVPPSDAQRLDTLPPVPLIEHAEAMLERSRSFALLSANELRNEVLARKVEAELRFSQPERGVRGALSDRGIVLQRYGPPDRIAAFPPRADGRTYSCGGSESTPDGGFVVTECFATSDASNVVTLWGYERLRQGFVFVGAPMFGTARFGGAFEHFAEALREVRPFDATELGYASRLVAATASVSRFRGDPRGGLPGATVLAAADFPVAHVLESAALTPVPVLIGSVVSAADPRQRLAVDSSVARLSADAPATLSRRWVQVVLSPSAIPRAVRLELVDPSTRAGARALVDLPPWNVDGRGTSDLLVATSLGRSSARRWFDLGAVPAVGAVRGDSLVLVWEAYALGTSDRWEYDVTIEVTRHDERRTLGGIGAALGSLLGVVRGARVERGADGVAITYRRAMVRPADDAVLEAVALNIRDLAAGRYGLRVEMRDADSAWETVLERVIDVVR